jgi:hypothetical protein
MKVKPSTRVPIFDWLTGELPDETVVFATSVNPAPAALSASARLAHHLLSLSRDVARRHDGPIVVERAGACREH